MRRTIALLGALLVAMSPAIAEDGSRPRSGPDVRVESADDCPISILERKSWVRATFDDDPWAAVRGTTPGNTGTTSRGSDRYQTVYHATFRNGSNSDIQAVALSWTALDADGRTLHEWTQVQAADPVGPGEIAVSHDLELRPAGDVATYVLSVYQVNLADGTVWTRARGRENAGP